jgi:hypothetical protein
VEVLINLILFKAGLLDEETDEANNSQAGHGEANSVVPWQACILLDSRGSRVGDSLEEDCTVFASLVGPILVLVEVMLVLVLTNSGAVRVGLILLTEVVVITMLLGLIALLSVTLILFGLVSLRVSLILLGLIVFAVVSLVLSGLVLPMRRVLLVQPSVTIVLADLLFVVLLLLVATAFLFVVLIVVFLPLSELLSQIHGNLTLHGLQLIALELGPQVQSDLRLQLGIVTESLMVITALLFPEGLGGGVGGSLVLKGVLCEAEDLPEEGKSHKVLLGCLVGSGLGETLGGCSCGQGNTQGHHS